MSVLVTGGTGFVGLNVIETLLNRGEHVVVLDRRPLTEEFLKTIGAKQSRGEFARQSECIARLWASEGSSRRVPQLVDGVRSESV